MQKSMVNITDPLRLDDLETLREDAEATEEILKELRSKYSSYNEDCRKGSRAKIRVARDETTSADVDSETSSKHDLRWGAPRESRFWRQPAAVPSSHTITLQI
jgi:hypothetical protein